MRLRGQVHASQQYIQKNHQKQIFHVPQIDYKVKIVKLKIKIIYSNYLFINISFNIYYWIIEYLIYGTF